jgi:hypothetical protein
VTPVYEFQVTATYTYRVTAEELQRYYDTVDPVSAALIDERNYNDIPYLLGEEVSQNRPDDFKVLVKARKL